MPPATAVTSRRARQERADALVAPVRFAAEAALAAHLAATTDRERLHQREWEQAQRDTLGDIDVLASALHGFASWATSQKPHPDAPSVVKKLEGELRATLKHDLPLLLGKGFPHLRDHLHRLNDLREALIAYFRETASGRRSTSKQAERKRSNR